MHSCVHVCDTFPTAAVTNGSCHLTLLPLAPLRADYEQSKDSDSLSKNSDLKALGFRVSGLGFRFAEQECGFEGFRV